MSPEVLLADEMNGQPLLPEHGFPLRVVVPGYIGARSVKWLSKVTLQAQPSDNYFQTQAYKLFPPSAQPESADWSQGVVLGEFQVNSAICQPRLGAELPAGPVIVRGYAIAPGGRSVQRVELSLDDGGTWRPADMIENSHPWAWTLWQVKLNLPPGSHQVAARAFDSQGNSQPEDPHKTWNFLGYANNAWHRIRFRIHVR